MQAEFQALRDLQYHPSDAAELNRLKTAYKDEQRKVEELRNTLAEKEKSLHQLGEKIKTMEFKLEQRLLLSDKEHTEKQLKRCQQISEMVTQFTQMKSVEEANQLVKDILQQTAKMRTSNRSTSWRC